MAYTVIIDTVIFVICIFLFFIWHHDFNLFVKEKGGEKLL